MRSPTLPLLMFLLVSTLAALGLACLTLPSEGVDRSAEFDHRIRNYLTSHPEVILEAVYEYRRHQRAEGGERQRAAVRANQVQLQATGLLPAAGNPKGTVTLVQFFDYRCPYCKQALPELHRLLAADGDVRLVYKEMPVLGSESRFAAQVAVAAALQGKYLEVHEALMRHTGPFAPAVVLGLARELGVDIKRLERDLEGPEVNDTINEGLSLARNLGINATPTFVVGEAIFQGFASAETLSSLVKRSRPRR